MKKYFIDIIITTSWLIFNFNILSAASIGIKATDSKPRIIITADPELDDNNSLIRFLLYATDFKIEGLIYSSSQFHWKGDGKGTKFMVPGREYTKYGLNLCPCSSYRWREDENFIHDAVNAYEKVYPNLIIHDESYPTPAYLKSKIKFGNIEFEGDYSKETEGSNLIKEILLDDIEGPVYVTAWGGQSTIARALKSIEEAYQDKENWKEIKEKVSKKLIILPSGEQDNTYATYIKPNWPNVGYRQYKNGPNYGYGAQLVANEENAPFLTANWMQENISSKGALGEIYRVWGDGKQMVKNDPFDYFGLDGYSNEELKKMGYVVWMPKQEKGAWLGEGDTGTFMNYLNNGLHADQILSLGGWGGRPFVPDPANYIDPFSNDTTKVKALVISEEYLKKQAAIAASEIPFPNFFPAAQNDFANRMNWSVQNNFKLANHAPILKTLSELNTKPGETLKIKANVKDPDGDNYTIKWWQFLEDKNTSALVIKNGNSLTPTVIIPKNAGTNKTLYLVLEVSDKNKISLTRYKTIKIII